MKQEADWPLFSIQAGFLVSNETYRVRDTNYINISRAPGSISLNTTYKRNFQFKNG